MLGPLGLDGGGFWAGQAGRCGVAVAAATRVSMPEDHHDSQPTENAAGSLVLVGDLRIDNRADLSSALGMSNSVSMPDNAFALAAYERWGEHMVDHLIGEFALGIVDRERGGVFIARDPVGARPLCIHERRGVVAFASNALALTELEGVGHVLDVKHAAEWLALAFSSERTFVEGVSWVPGGSAVWIDTTGPRRWRWWDPDPDEIVDLGSPGAHEQALREAFDEAVAARMRSSGNVGAMVSGGLDSTSVAATSAQLLAPDPLRTYTSAPPPGWSPAWEGGMDVDESPLVRELADMHPNILPTFIHVDGSELFTMHERLWELGAGPIRNPCNMLWVHAIRTKAGADGITTLLTGDFGNMYFSPEGHHWFFETLRVGRIRMALSEAAAWRRVSGAGWYRLIREHLAPYAMPRVFGWGRKALRRPGQLDLWLDGSALRPEIATDLDLLELLPYLDERRRNEHRTHRLGVLQESAGQADNAAALTALTGVVATDPTVDRRVIEVGMRQPEWARQRDGIGRAIVRGAMADRLPAAIVQRRKRGAQLPEWLDIMTAIRPDLGTELDALEQHSTSRELMDVDRLRSLFERWPERSGGGDIEVHREYRSAFLRALVLSRYLRWFEARATEMARVGASNR